MYCKHAYTYVLICGKGNRLKIHKWYNKRKVTVQLFRNGRKVKTYVLKHDNASRLWKFVGQLHRNFLYSKQYFKHIENKNVLINLYFQLFEDILNMVTKYANTNENSQCKSESKVSQNNKKTGNNQRQIQYTY